MSKREDVLDMVMIQIANRTNREDIKKIVSDAITDTRQIYQGQAYVRQDNQHSKTAYTLWLQQKTTDKTMKEIYVFIADHIGTVTPRTIESYIRKFLKGYNPHTENERYANTI